MKLSALLFPGEYTSAYHTEEIEITSICFTCEAVRQGSLFICLCGTHYNTHALLSTVAENGAAAALVEDGEEFVTPDGFPVFSVTSTRRALSFAFDRFYRSPAKEMRLIGITGTNGKTSTATMIYTILCAAGYRTAIIGTVSCRTQEKDYSAEIPEERRVMTTPDPDILYPMLSHMRDDGVEFVVIEVSSHALALEKVAPLAFEVALFTNLSPEHLDFHMTMENYLAAKARLFSQCKCGILNFDDAFAEKIAARANCPILRCGAVYHEQFNAEEIRSQGARGISYVFSSSTLRMAVHLPIPGYFTVYNSLLALCCTTYLGVAPMVEKQALSDLHGIPGRMERLDLDPTISEFSVFIDYAHTEAALRNLLLTVRGFRLNGERIVLVFGCGGDRDTGKRAPMGRIAEEYADFIIVTSDNSRTEEPSKIIRDILLGMKNKEKRRVILRRGDAITYAIRTAQENDIILLAGKGHETYELREGKRYVFDEKRIVEEALLQRKKEKEFHENLS